MIETYRKERRGKLPAEPKDILDAVMTDLRFRIPALRWAEAQSQHQPQVFSYLFTYKSTAMNGVLGACHALEIPFVFGTLGEKKRGIYPPRSAETDRLSEAMMDAWTAFARNGNPTHQSLEPWAPYEPTGRRTMLLGSSPHLEEDPFGAERKLWEGLI
jgi:para-nitrobenzyl esterase